MHQGQTLPLLTKGGPKGPKAQLEPWCEQPSKGNCKDNRKSFTNLNNKQTPKRKSKGSP
jgi:hypothetical protein